MLGGCATADHAALRRLRTCAQDAVVKGWFRTSREPTKGGTHLRVVALTAYEVASAMAYIHSNGIAHLVRLLFSWSCDPDVLLLTL